MRVSIRAPMMVSLTPEQKFEIAKEYRAVAHEGLVHSSKRGSELSDEYTRLEVQIATVLFAFAGVFFGDFVTDSLSMFPPAGVVLVKLIFSMGLGFLLASLVSGLLHMKRKEKFWDEMMYNKVAVFKRWNMEGRGEVTFEEARAFQLGVAQGEERVISSPIWTWVLQTIFLGIGIGLLFILGLVLLFW